MFSLRTHAIITGAILALIILLAIVGDVLQAAHIVKDPESLEAPAEILFFTLFLALAFSAVPLLVKLFLAGQARLGNAELGPVKALARHQVAVIWVFWLLFLGGLAIAIPAAVDQGFFGVEGGWALRALFEGGSEGTLLARPDMMVDDMIRQSTLPLDRVEQPSGPYPVPIAGGARFDFKIPGTGMVFRDCRYYFITTLTGDPQRIEGMSIGTSSGTMTRAELDAADADLRARLGADGWLAGHEEYRTEEDRQLHGGAVRGPEGEIWLKDDMVLNILSRRMDEPVAGEDPARAGAWIQYVELWDRKTYASFDRYVFAPPDN